MTRKLICSLIALLLALPAVAEDIEISYDQLPEKARSVIAKAFPDVKVKKVEMERRASLMQYEVKLYGGIKLQFSKDGTFTECDCTSSGQVPDVLIPSKIRAFMSKEFDGRKIKRIEHDSKLYELLLDNGVELSFNSAFRLIDIDRAEE